eukprot:scaffold8266_cov69-Isochrysis_galbana.AAC.3
MRVGCRGHCGASGPGGEGWGGVGGARPRLRCRNGGGGCGPGWVGACRQAGGDMREVWPAQRVCASIQIGGYGGRLDIGPGQGVWLARGEGGRRTWPRL